MAGQKESAVVAFGRGSAAIVTSSFGFVWLGWGFSALRNLPTSIWIVLDCAAVPLLIFAIIAMRRGKRMMRAEGVSTSDFWKTRRKPFVIVTVLEVAGCMLAVWLANMFHRPDLIAFSISLVVGLHFLPLGKIFGYTSYYWVGTLIVMWNLLTVIALKSLNPTASVGIATGLILWATSIFVLRRSFRHVPS